MITTTDSLRLAPLDTSSARQETVCEEPPVSPLPRACMWRSNSPTSVLQKPQSARPSISIEALTSPSPSAPPKHQHPPLPMFTPPRMAATQQYINNAFPQPSVDIPTYSTAPAPLSPAIKLKPPKRKRSRAGASRDVFKCPFPNCNKVSSENSNLKAHMRLHTGERPYVCKRAGCEKSFRWKSSLTYHEKALHSNLRPFVCVSCEKRFVEKRKLQLHRDWCPALRQQVENDNKERKEREIRALSSMLPNVNVSNPSQNQHSTMWKYDCAPTARVGSQLVYPPSMHGVPSLP